ncbi:hypothetical protein EAO03_30355 [Klebsiella pneumoniae]|nr:hypothetical protein EAO03_30355 [Klebsiella pneumoniae]
MRNWYLLQCRVQNFQRITTRIHMLNIESFVPTEVKSHDAGTVTAAGRRKSRSFPGIFFCDLIRRKSIPQLSPRSRSQTFRQFWWSA